MTFQHIVGATYRALTARKDGPSLYDVCDPLLLNYAGGDPHLPPGGGKEASEVADYLRGPAPRIEEQAHDHAAAQMITGTEPPSTDHAAPATFEARSEHRKTIAAAISSGSASRRIGRFEPAASSASSRLGWPASSFD